MDKRWSEMTPRERDYWLAEHVAGWERHDGKHPDPKVWCKTIPEGDQVWWRRPGCDVWECGPCYDVPPHYSEDTAAAIGLAEPLHAYWRVEKEDGGFVFFARSDSRLSKSSHCSTAAEAITQGIFLHCNEYGVFGA